VINNWSFTMNIPSFLTVLFIFLTLCLVLVGCERPGPAERTGERIDETIEDAGERIQEAGEDIEDAGRGR